METITCDLCKGAGLIGNGPEPHLLQGEKRVCPKCGGRGILTVDGAKIEPEQPQQATDDTQQVIEPQPEQPKKKFLGIF